MSIVRKIAITLAIMGFVLMSAGCDVQRFYPPPDTITYFDTIEEAIEEAGFSTTGKITRLIQNDGNAFFIIIDPESTTYSWIHVLLFYTMINEYGNTMFSRVVVSRGISLVMHMNWMTLGGMNEIGEIRNGVATSIWSDHLWEFTGVGEHVSQRPAWGISQTERVHNLKIEGQPVTEVIEFEFDGEIVYFWYFEDLETDKNPYFYGPPETHDPNVGEMDITMEP